MSEVVNTCKVLRAPSKLLRPVRFYRDPTLDTIRGVLLTLMALNHIDSDLRGVADQPLGFVSAAEGLVFLSGFLLGRIDHPTTHDSDRLWSNAYRRAKRVYIWHIAIVVLVWLWVQIWPFIDSADPTRLPRLFYESRWAGLLAACSLLYQPGLLDILPMYIGFPLLVPLILRLYQQGRGLPTWLASGAMWGASQVLLPPYPIESGPINTGAFHILCWQWLFVTGVLLGAHSHQEWRILQRPKYWMITLAVAGAVFLYIVRRPELPNWWDYETLDILTRKISLGLLRISNFALLAYLIAIIRRKTPRLLAAEPFAAIGRHPLPVFAASILSAMVSLSFAESGDTSAGRWVQTTFVLTSVAFTVAWLEFNASSGKIKTG